MRSLDEMRAIDAALPLRRCGNVHSALSCPACVLQERIAALEAERDRLRVAIDEALALYPSVREEDMILGLRETRRILRVALEPAP